MLITSYLGGVFFASVRAMQMYFITILTSKKILMQDFKVYID